jgi:hypothetical protein
LGGVADKNNPTPSFSRIHINKIRQKSKTFTAGRGMLGVIGAIW